MSLRDLAERLRTHAPKSRGIAAEAFADVIAAAAEGEALAHSRTGTLARSIETHVDGGRVQLKAERYLRFIGRFRHGIPEDVLIAGRANAERALGR